MVDQIYVANLVAWFNKKKRKPKQSTKLCDLKKKVLKSGKNVSRLRDVSEFWRINHSKWNEKRSIFLQFSIIEIAFWISKHFQNWKANYEIREREWKIEFESWQALERVRRKNFKLKH